MVLPMGRPLLYPRPEIGTRFSRIIITGHIGSIGDRLSYVCDCGNKGETSYASIRFGRMGSCGCLHKEMMTRLHSTHRARSSGDALKSKAYNTWASMLQRCNVNIASCDSDYGGRGISVCGKWKSFVGFYEDMGSPPSLDHSIDRINVNGNYQKANCRWATRREQALNKRDSWRINFRGKSLNIYEAAEVSGIPSGTLRARLGRLGWTPEQALTIPLIPGHHLRRLEATR